MKGDQEGLTKIVAYCETVNASGQMVNSEGTRWIRLYKERLLDVLFLLSNTSHSFKPRSLPNKFQLDLTSDHSNNLLPLHSLQYNALCDIRFFSIGLSRFVDL